MQARWLLIGIFWAFAAVGCGDDDDTAGDGDADADTDADADADDEVTGDEACGACDDPPDCSDNQVLSCCTCVRRPTADLARTPCGAVDEECGSGAPDLSCFSVDDPPVAGTSEDVTLFGVIDVFGNGVDADDITLEIYLPSDTCGAEPGTLIGTATAHVAGCADALTARSVDSAACQEEDPDNEGEFRSLGYYEFTEAVPTETLLALRTSGNAALWKPLVLYNLYFHNDDVTDGAVFYKARVLSTDDYRTIPASAGMPAGIARGHGAIAGEVHDCGDVRLSFAQVATIPAPPAPYTITYFNDNPDDPLPVASRTEGTSVLGLWASLDLPPGPARLVAVGSSGGQIVSAGWFDACVFADTVSAVTLRGLRPSQVP